MLGAHVSQYRGSFEGGDWVAGLATSNGRRGYLAGPYTKSAYAYNLRKRLSLVSRGSFHDPQGFASGAYCFTHLLPTKNVVLHNRVRSSKAPAK